MDNFEEQLINNLRNSINEFNNKPEYTEIRELYKHHFDTISGYIRKAGVKSAVEDISNLDRSLTQSVLDNILLLKEINKAILQQELKLSDIK